MRRFAFIGLALLAGCAHPGVPENPPPPPAADVPYLAPDALDLTQLLPPPPAAGSAAEADDLKALETVQRTRTPARFVQARADLVVSYDKFADALGPGFVTDKLPLTMKFLGKVSRSVGPFILVTKECYERPRPFLVDKKLKPTSDLLKSAGALPPSANAQLPQTPQGPNSPCLPPKAETDYAYSYPSGHSTFGAMTAILLAQMVPEKRAALYARGWDYGQSRVVGTVHYPTDVAVGRIQATVLVAAMMSNPRFKADMAAARAELRAALGLSN